MRGREPVSASTNGPRLLSELPLTTLRANEQSEQSPPQGLCSFARSGLAGSGRPFARLLALLAAITARARPTFARSHHGEGEADLCSLCSFARKALAEARPRSQRRRAGRFVVAWPTVKGRWSVPGRWLGPVGCETGNPTIPGAVQKAGVVVAGGGGRTGGCLCWLACRRRERAINQAGTIRIPSSENRVSGALSQILSSSPQLQIINKPARNSRPTPITYCSPQDLTRKTRVILACAR